MMIAVCAHPAQSASFQAERAEEGESVFHPFRALEATMREQAVIAEADAESAGDPDQSDEGPERRPGEGKRGQQCSGVNNNGANE